MSNLQKGLLSLAIALSVIACLVALKSKQGQIPFLPGSVNVANEYHATSTRNFDGTALTNLTVLNSGNSGALGSIVITGAGAGQINFYDATTSNKNLRQSTFASTTQLIATIPVSAAAGTYTFDTAYSYGLLIEIIGTTPTSTVTFR